MDIRKIIASFFIMLKEDTYVLVRIQALVSLVTVLFLVLIILDFFRCRNRSSLLTTLFKTVDSVSDRIVLYLLGTMQAASFDNQMFPVWAVVLVSLRASLGYLSGYGIQDHHRRLTELGNVIKFLGAGVLNHTRGLKFTKPLWSLWGILLARSIYRFVAHNMAMRSLWHGRNAEFLPEYMREGARDREQGDNWQVIDSSADPGGQDNDNDKRYLVCGESSQKIEVKRPSYTLHLEVDHSTSSSLITLDKISGCPQPLLSPENSFSRRYKDTSVAFTLSRLLRCRFEDATLQIESIVTTRNLIISKIIEIESQQAAAVTAAEAEAVAAEETGMVRQTETIEVTAAEAEAEAEAVAAEDTEMVPEAEAETAEEKEGKRAFKILELELAFTRDYFYTLYPLVFCSGLSSLFLSLILSMATFGIALWLAVDIRTVYHLHPDKDNFMLQMHGGNIDVLITWLFMGFMMLKEIWEITTYLLSNWTRLLLVCKYVESKLWLIFLDMKYSRPLQWMRTTILLSKFRLWRLVLKDRLLRLLYKEYKIAGAWHGSMDQYDFLQSCSYKPFIPKVAAAISLGKFQAKADGRKSGEAIKVPACVKPAILRALRHIGLNSTQLPREIPSLSHSVQGFDRYSWACFKLHTCSQVILVWHITTSLCEIELEEECKIDLPKPDEFVRSAWSRLKTFSCCTSEPYLVKKNKNLHGEVETNYHVATSLSRYCAYLQAFRSPLLPDNFVVPALIFTETLKEAREVLKDCNLVKCRYNKIMVLAEEAAKENLDKVQDMSILQQGATLAKALIENEDKGNRWKIIAEVWADLLVHIAPSWNAADHKYYLESGGEFLTLIWALLSHCGIEKSRLWDKVESPGSNARVPHANSTGTGHNNILEKQLVSQVQQQNSTETGNNQSLEKQQVSESNPQVPQENNAETSNARVVDEHQASENSAQVPQENIAESTDLQNKVDQQVSQGNAEIPQEINTENTNIQSEEDVTEDDLEEF